MNKESIILDLFKIHPEYKGQNVGENIIFFTGKDYESCLFNELTGKSRILSSVSGNVLIDDKEIDYVTINKECEHGFYSAANKIQRYGSLNTWDGFKKGICAICWTLYPDGEYFADSDGFGMEDNDEVIIYGIIDSNFRFIEPFRPIKDIKSYLKLIRENPKRIDTNNE